MTEQSESGLVKPHVLIVGGGLGISGHRGLGEVLQREGISYELATHAETALERLNGDEPPIAGVLTAGLEGDYPQVIEAARRVGANAVLMTRSTLTLHRAREEQQIPTYLYSKIVGRMRERAVVRSLILDLIPSMVTH